MSAPIISVDEYIAGNIPSGAVVKITNDEEMERITRFVSTGEIPFPTYTTSPYAPEPDTCLDRARQITQERGDNRGHPIINVSRYAKILSAILDVEVSLTQASLALLGIKIARESSSHSRDNVDDIAGYAWVLEAVQKREGTW